MINLLPAYEKKKVTRRYYMRLASVFVFMVSCVLLFGSALLLPTFILLRDEAQVSAQYLETSEASLRLAERSAQGRKVAALIERQRILVPYAKQGSAADMLTALLATRPNGVSITTIGYMHKDGATEVNFSGTAPTRTLLVGFTDALRRSAAFESVSLPISSLIADEDIPFSFSVEYRHKNI